MTTPTKTTPPKKFATVPPKKRTSTEERREGVQGALQLLAGGILMLARGNIALQADAATVIHHAPALTTELVNIADDDERFGALIDRVVTAGPYSRLLTVIFGVGIQIATNHERLPAGFLGVTLDREDLIAMVLEGGTDDKPTDTTRGKADGRVSAAAHNST